MEEKSILIQSDEVTKNIMSEIQDDMANALSKVSRNMSEEVIEKLIPIEKKINDLKGSFQEFQEEEFEEKLEDLNNSIKNISKTIENTIEAAINKNLEEQNKVLFSSIEDRLAILGLKIVKDATSNKEEIINKIDNINLGKVEEKVEEVGKSIESKTKAVEKSIKDNLVSGNNFVLEKIKKIDDKIEDKDVLIELINKIEDSFNERIDNIQEEVEWGNKSIFARIFGKRREQ
ncbi:ribosomal protein L17 [Clostridium saccharoperbutylacetonicum]|uniref:Viral A-type inclusion protein n=1 Tax=Clostridium saccharoperbutylacetonicum N1-4(HMT) TaxID=931276 RepID=M1MPJ0_9CLOT|nr:hypothetical protein [Clostridium saccharoperbutylacetonicum]AGF58138.1 hypothetical protein Cspa_c43850 [Clostridium saccharoperbutylacetonicum N1-4(HMT)]NRT61088.1 ribosomal protein L17 [Clostridium saccharoperbutylacetonicum]NSB24403.1 ribosomal protein L17 [Clostridium saccharoperbutylacetonicum]NSB43779.1 ribosomal protein L17 [Clostridium saccharoperbutylacetonicum]